jgi:pyruvate/2-oxoglutarate dehydrogenase complex dihydrolipoamide dehydrogenase (E3) component/uncharacterized membrane protein YdjX (TVP38/TMEM64 family)
MSKIKIDKKTYDCIVIGGGSGGLTVARSLARAGKLVALVEKHILGGDCTNYGCVPSKTLLSYVRENPAAGLQKALAHMRAVRAKILEEEDEQTLQKEVVDVLLGTGAVLRRGVVEVMDSASVKKEFVTKKIVLATGSTPTRIPIVGVDSKKIITNEELFELTDNPKKVCILGGGYIGCEMAEALVRAGVAVTVVQREDRLVPREELESSAALLEFLKSIGVRVQLNSSLDKIVADKVVASLDAFDYILLALGRAPRVPAGLADVGVEVKRGIVVNKYNETSLKNVYAIGDCVEGNPTFTHWANNEGRGLVRNILVPFWKKSVRSEVLPTVLYTELEIARVGGAEKELREMYGDRLRSATVYFKNNDRAKTEGDAAGFAKVYFTPLFGRIVGGSIVGRHAGEMLPRLVAAVRNGERASMLSAEVVAYPTRAEVLKKAADAFLLETLKNWKSEVWQALVCGVRKYALRVGAACVWLGAVALLYKTLRETGMTPLMLAEDLYIFVNATWYGPVAYMFVYMFRSLFFLPATLVTILSGIIFGPLLGPIYTWVGENMSAQLSYVVGRFFRGAPTASDAAHAGMLSALGGRSAFFGVLMGRFMFLPFDLFNYAAGFARIEWRGYTLGTMLGIIPGLTAFVLAGAAVNPAEFFATGKVAVNWNILLLSLALIAGSLGVARWVRR